MDSTQITDLMKWFIAIGIGSIVTAITGIFMLIKAGRMLPKDERKADLENKGKELDLTEKYDDIANRAADKALKAQGELEEYKIATDLKFQALEKKFNAQIKEQSEEIEFLKCEISNYKLYTSALIEQLRTANIVPVEMSTLPLEECEKPAKRKKNRMEDKNATI